MKRPPIAEQDMERYSSAITLSDMEVFIFPELILSLVLANLLSPRLWAWREDRWFIKASRKNTYRRTLRLKQYIIDHYEFNLDLDTWGLTTKTREVERFAPWVDQEILRSSNALFGYEGDQYYFDLDIRRHFGLDQYTKEAIPYWKTETLEAMDAFRFKEGYQFGAGECVSLAVLYAAALFLVAGVPLEDIFLMATPLHSQNFIDLKDGILTNNRRLVTKTMWFNGTELTAKAQRALRNERVTLVAHPSGVIHTLYREATIDPDAYRRFHGKLTAFNRTTFEAGLLANFLRQHSDLQACFQLSHEHHGRQRYIALEKVYHYEHASPQRVNDDTRSALLGEIDEYEFSPTPLDGRIDLDELEGTLCAERIDSGDSARLAAVVARFNCYHHRAGEVLRLLQEFMHITPRLPASAEKTFVPQEPIRLTSDMPREAMFAALEALRESNPAADLAFYAYRDLARMDWRPFFKAALERNPVCVAASGELDLAACRAHLEAMPNESIYDGTRAAQPDEVWNFGRGDGFEKACCLAAILRARRPADPLEFIADGDRTLLRTKGLETQWPGGKGLQAQMTL